MNMHSLCGETIQWQSDGETVVESWTELTVELSAVPYGHKLEKSH